MHGRSRKQFFHSNVYEIFKRKHMKVQTISSKKSSGHHISVSIKGTYLCFSLNDRLLVISLVISRLVSL